MEISNLGKGLPYTIRKLLPQQVRRIMRLTAILLTVGCLQVSAHSYEQTVSFIGKNVPLTTVFKSIERQTGLSFFFNFSAVKNAGSVTIRAENVDLSYLLNAILLPRGLEYYLKGKTVFIVEKSKDGDQFVRPAELPKKGIDVKGRVTTVTGESLAGATVMVKNGKSGTVTNANGMFELKNVPANSVLIVSFTGYQKKEVPADDDQPIEVQLAVAENKLDQAQVIAYGQTTERLSVGNIATVKADEIERQPVNNVLEALEGKLPGVFIKQSTGFSGTGVAVRVEGQNSIQNGNDPFYVIDGIPYSGEFISNSPLGLGNILGTSGTSGMAGNPLSYLNPNDIESITVLKDADATAIYGSRAANGAILITTKKGRVGDAKVSLNFEDGGAQTSRRLNLLNRPQYLEMRREALKNSGILAPGSTDYDLNGLWDTTSNTDWQKKLIGRTAAYMDANGNVSGGSQLTQYLVGASFHRETTVMPGDFSDIKGSAHFNLNSSSANQKLRVRFSALYLADRNVLPGADLTAKAVQLAPDAPSLYAAGGALNWAPNSVGTSSWANPLAVIYQYYKNKANNLISSATVGYNLLKGLELKGDVGYTNTQTNEVTVSPLAAVAPESRSVTLRSAAYGNHTISTWNVEPQVHYTQNIGKSKFDVLVGATFLRTYSTGQYYTGTGFINDAVLEDIHSAANVSVNSAVNSVYSYNAIFGRISYNFNDKYLVNLTGRRDGSSRFGPANQFHNFAAAGAAWVFSKEGIIEKHLHFLSYGKLKASYGTSGNDQIGDYQFLNLYNPYNVGVPYQNATALLPNGLANPYLQWEETKKFQAGVELGFWRDRLLLNGTYFNNLSSNQLLRYNLPIITGSANILENFPATVRNYGWELSETSTNIRSGNFSWSTSISVTIPYNKLEKFPNIASSSYANLLVVGKPVTIRKLFHLAGVDVNRGVYEFRNSHGGDTSTPNSLTDNISLVNVAPTLYGGMNNTFSYRGFQLDIFIQFVMQKGPNFFYGNAPSAGYAGINQPKYVLGRWQAPGNLSAIQKFTSNFSLLTQYFDVLQSDGAISDASYIRLKNVNLSWELPNAWKKALHIQGLRLFCQGQNLVMLTKYRGLDPETLSSNTLPTLRIIVAGARLDL